MEKLKITWNAEEKEKFGKLIKGLHEGNPDLSKQALHQMAMNSFPTERKRPWSGPMGDLVREVLGGASRKTRGKKQEKEPKKEPKKVHQAEPKTAGAKEATNGNTEYGQYERHAERKPGPVLVFHPPPPTEQLPESAKPPQVEIEKPTAGIADADKIRALEQELNAIKIKTLQKEVSENSRTIDSLETMVFDKQDSVDQIADSLSRILIETACRFLESPAVRKAARSLIKVATDPNFTPEIDNTEPWVKPAFGPKKPRVLVVGSPRGSFVQSLLGEFRDKLDLRFWKTDDSYHQLRADVRTAEIIVILASYTNHSVRQICVAARKRLITLPISGSLTRMKHTLEQLSKEFEGALAAPAGGGEF